MRERESESEREGGGPQSRYKKVLQAGIRPQTTEAASPLFFFMVFVCHWLEAMTLLLSLLGVVLCSLAGSSQVLPQADFNTQAVSGIIA